MKQTNMNDIEISFAIEFLDNMGISANRNMYIIDEDTEQVLKMKNKPIRFNQNTSYSEIRFNPLRSVVLANKLFNNFLRILERDNIYVSLYIIYTAPNNSKKIIFTVEENGIKESKSTKEYFNEAICYLDAAKQLNGETDFDLSMYDDQKQ